MIRRLQTAWEKGRERLAGRTKVKASIYYASSSIICQVLRFAALIVSMRLIAADQFGYFAQATLALSYSGFLRDIGQNNALASYPGRDQRYTTYNFQINLALGTLAALALLFVLKCVPGIPASLGRVAFLLAAVTFCEAVNFTGFVTAQREFRFRLIAVSDIAAVTTYLVTLVTLIRWLDGFLVLLCAQLAETAVRMLILGFGLRWYFVGRANGKDLRDFYYRKHLPVWVPQNLLQTTTGRIDYQLLSGFSSVYELGVYSQVLQFVRIPCSLSINLLDRVLLASYSKEQNSPAALRSTVAKARWLILGAAATATLVTTLGIVLVLARLIGASWTAAILKDWWLAIPYAIIVPLVWNHNIFMQGTGNPKYLLITTLLTATGDLVLGSLVLAAGYRVGGLFVARTLVQAGVFALQCIFVRRLSRVRQPPDPSPESVQRVNSNMPQA